MEGMPFQKLSPIALSLTRDTPCEESASSLPSRNTMLSKQVWENFKPIIRELYLDRGQTLKQLAKYLEEQHRFKPTKKQLTYHISCWGFEKNVKKNERRAIIECLGAEIEKLDVASQVHRGRTLDKAKLNRWMRLENRSFTSSLAVDDQLEDHSAAFREAEVPAPKGIPYHDEQTGNSQHSKKSEFASFDSIDDRVYWGSVDLIGSPRLTKLIGALTIEDCDITALDLDTNISKVEDILKKDLLDLYSKDDSAEERKNSSHRPEKCTKHFWQNELYPFPALPPSTRVARDFCSGIFFQPKLSDLECKRQLRNLHHLTYSEVIHLVRLMDTEAERLFSLGFWGAAETWLRRVITAKQKVKWYNPQQTLRACVDVIACMARQDRPKEAQQLHKDFHIKIERLLGIHHNICLRSRSVLAAILLKLEFLAEAESIHRQVLQSLLVTFGPRHPSTISALQNLAYYLEPLGQRNEEAQQLLEIVVRFRLETIKFPGDAGVKEIATVRTIGLLAAAFDSDGRYNESEALRSYAQRMLGNATKRVCSQTFGYYCQKARGYRLQKRFDESGKILRGLLRHHERSMCCDMKTTVIGELTKVLIQTSRQREAEAWLRKYYLLNLKMYGPAHYYTMSCCANIGICLSRQGRLNEAKLFFEEVLKVLASKDGKQMESRADCIQTVNNWILTSEKMIMRDSMEMRSRSGNSERKRLATDYDEDMDDNFDPLCGS